MHVLIDMKT